MAKPKEGSVVKADFGNGPEYGLLVNVGGDKDIVVPLGKGQPLGYREPEDRDERGSGTTYWTAD